jgi:hypothetical protein
MLHSLNGLRVGAEFLVVHYHLTARSPGRMFSSDLMSFFFVLSGFVSAYANPDGPTEGFMRRRLGTMLGPFWLSSLMDLPAAIMTQPIPGCDLFWPGCLMQALLLSPWTGHFHFAHPNSVAWYAACLVWLWLCFAWLPPGGVFKSRPWTVALGLYAVSQLLFLLATPLMEETKRILPILRLPEFYMGCAIAYADRKNALRPLAACNGRRTRSSSASARSRSTCICFTC